MPLLTTVEVQYTRNIEVCLLLPSNDCILVVVDWLWPCRTLGRARRIEPLCCPWPWLWCKKGVLLVHRVERTYTETSPSPLDLIQQQSTIGNFLLRCSCLPKVFLRKHSNVIRIFAVTACSSILVRVRVALRPCCVQMSFYPIEDAMGLFLALIVLARRRSNWKHSGANGWLKNACFSFLFLLCAQGEPYFRKFLLHCPFMTVRPHLPMSHSGGMYANNAKKKKKKNWTQTWPCTRALLFRGIEGTEYPVR